MSPPPFRSNWQWQSGRHTTGNGERGEEGREREKGTMLGVLMELHIHSVPPPGVT